MMGPSLPSKLTGPAVKEKAKSNCRSALPRRSSAPLHQSSLAAASIILAASAKTISFLKENLRPVGPPDAERVNRLIADLDSEQFGVRKKPPKNCSKPAPTQHRSSAKRSVASRRQKRADA
jgi:hypothetical protein